MPDPTAAPGDLELVRLFLNTADLEAGKEDLPSPEALRAWFTARTGDPGVVDAGGLRRALALREAIRGLALANNGGQAYPVDLATLNRAVVECGLRPRFGRGGTARLEPEAEGLDRSLGRLVAAVHEAMSTGTWARLKACGRHSCRWAFYDVSRNQSRTWCSMATCGNRTKAQRFRARSAHS
jgi:predicted RNA-binding Zn ribbon-like protein